MEDFPKQNESVEFPEIAEELKVMHVVDQDMREKGIIDFEQWDENIDKNNTERMKQIIVQIGWPTVSKVGKEGAKYAWLLVQHADHDVEFQKSCLILMKEQNTDEVELRDIAYLTDRICVNSNIPQVYGTQFRDTNDVFTPKEIEDIEHVDERRKQMGLGTLEEGIELMYKKYKTDKAEE